MDFAHKVGFSLIVISCLVIGAGSLLIRYYTPEPAPLIDTDWQTVEAAVERDIGSVGYQFLTSGGTIPAIKQEDYESCLQTYAELKPVNRDFNREYLFKYNQIVHIRMLRAGINCRE